MNYHTTVPAVGAMTNEDILQKLDALVRLLQKRFRSLYPTLGKLTFLQLQALLYIREAGRVHMRELADNLEISPSSSTALVDRLVRLKWLTRIADVRDRRTQLLTLRAQSKAHLEQVLAKKFHHLGEMLNTLSQHDRHFLTRILTTLEDRARSITNRTL